MNLNLQLFIAELEVADTLDEVWKIVTKFYGNFGFDSIIYADLTMGDVEILTSLPEKWQEHYVDQDYQLIDPFFEYCCKSMLSINTGIEYLPKYEFLESPAKKLIGEASEAGLRAGFSVTFKQLSAAGAGGWNIGSSLDKASVEKIKHEHSETLQLASFFAREAIVAVKKNSNAFVELSHRETECLQWLATGLRTKEIAHKLGIKPVSVELYINNAKKKLNAATREELVAKAITQNKILL